MQLGGRLKRSVRAPYGLKASSLCKLQGDILLASRHHRAQRYKRPCLKAFQTALRVLYKLLRELMYGFAQRVASSWRGHYAPPPRTQKKSTSLKHARQPVRSARGSYPLRRVRAPGAKQAAALRRASPDQPRSAVLLFCFFFLKIIVSAALIGCLFSLVSSGVKCPFFLLFSRVFEPLADKGSGVRIP